MAPLPYRERRGAGERPRIMARDRHEGQDGPPALVVAQEEEEEGRRGVGGRLGGGGRRVLPTGHILTRPIPKMFRILPRWLRYFFPK